MNKKRKHYTSREARTSPARGLFTLHTAGRPTIPEVIGWIDSLGQEDGRTLSHVSFGEQGTFDAQNMTRWVDLVTYFLREGYWCTLVCRPKQIPLLLKTALPRHARFIPLVVFPLSGIRMLGHNLSVKAEEPPACA